jgi:ATP-dependent DNA helicase RecQ
MVAGDEHLFQNLRAWRLEKARQLAQPPFVVFHDSVLRAIASGRPRSREQLGQIRGVGPRKLEAYGQEILAMVAAQPKTPDSGSE